MKDMDADKGSVALRKGEAWLLWHGCVWGAAVDLKNVLTHPMVRSITVTTLWSTAAKSVGFVVPFFVAAWFGVSAETDVFFFVYGMIMFLTGIFATSIEAVIVPFVADVDAKDRGELGSFVGNCLIFSSLGILLLGGLFMAFIKPFARVLTHFSAEQLQLLFWLSIETVPLLWLLSVTSILGGVLNARKRFLIPALSPAFRACVTIAAIFMLKDRIGVHAIAAGYVLGELSRLLLLLFLIARQKIFALDLVVRITPQVKDFLRTASYQVVCLSAVGLNPVIDKTMASWLAPGSVSILYYADRLYMIPVGLLSAGLFPVTLSHWSSALNSGEDRAVFVSRVNRTAKFALGFSLIMAVILMLLSQPMIQLIFGRGRFPAVSMPLLGSTWACYLLGLAPYIAGSMFTQAHLALKNTAFLMKAGFVNCVLNVLLNLVFMRLFGVAGIALATTITVMATAVILFISFSTTGRDNEKH